MERDPALRIGVTGHRILAEVDKIDRGVERALDRICERFPGSPTIHSPLAEGADRIVAHRVLSRPGARLVALLPLPREDYLQDFESEESKQEFLALLGRAEEVIELPASPSRNAAYEAVGWEVLERAEVMIAIWDGQGVQCGGGTGGIVAEARRRGMPIAWIHAGNRRPETNEPTSLGEEQGSVTFENMQR